MDANGYYGTDYIYYYSVNAVGYSSQDYYLYTQSDYVANWSDGRGNLGAGSYPYQVTVVGYNLVPYDNGWVDGHWEDDHDNPDDPDEVTGSHWEDGHYDAGFNWNWGTIGTASIQFNLQATPPVITSAASASGTASVAFSYTIMATNSPTSYSVAETLPAGLAVNPSTGVIGGTPSQTGAFSLTMRATNASGTGSAPLVLAIAAPSAPGITAQPANQVLAGAATGASLVAGMGHSLALMLDGTVRAWGWNGYGQLGDGSTNDRLTAMQVGGLTGVTALGSGYGHSLAVKNDGTVWTWGVNFTGQLGDGTTINRTTPVNVGGLSGVVAVAAGSSHSLALKSDGRVWAWGWNVYGMVGDGTTVDRWTPVLVGGVTGVVAIAAGEYHSLALKPDGTVWAWGWAGFGGLGDGTTAVTRTTPVQVMNLNSANGLASGFYYNLARTSAGTVWAWGRGVNGALGNGAEADTSLPVAVSNLGDVSAIAAHGFGSHGLARKSTGSVWAWGNNANGQIGDGTSINRNLPVAVGGLGNVAVVAAGASHSLAAKVDGTVWSWGRNSWGGALGDGTYIDRALPVQVMGLSGVAVPGTTSLSFTVAATGNPAPTYQWQRKPVGQSTFTNLADNSTYAGAGTAALLVNNATPAMIGDEFRCVVSNSIGSATSNTAAIAPLSGAPVIVTQPAGTTVLQGQTATFSVVATGNPTPTYQWRKGGAAIAGATTATLTLANAQPAATGAYDVVVTNAAGSITSNTVALSVSVAPAITTQPVGATVNPGQTVTFTVAATGTPAPTYQWRKASATISGATNSSLTLANVQTNSAGGYDVVASNSVGSVTSATATLAVTLPVNVAPAITTQPVSATVDPGQTATFTVIATGTPAPAYQWRKASVTISGATNASLTLTNVQVSDAGNYDVVVTNPGGSIASSAVTLTVNVPPTITTQPQSATVVLGGSATFSVVATGSPAPTYQWRKTGTALSGKTDATLTWPFVQAADAGNYDVVATNSAGSATSNSATLTVNASTNATITLSNLYQTYDGTPRIVTATTAPSGLSVSITYDGSSTAPTNASTYSVFATVTSPGYQGETSGTLVVSKKPSTITLSNLVQVYDGNPKSPAATTNPSGLAVNFTFDGNPSPPSAPGDYVLTATINDTNHEGVVNAEFSITQPPGISLQPASVAAPLGLPTAFSVTAFGTPPMQYQWRKNGSPIPGANMFRLTIPAVSSADVASYDVVVTNDYGSLTSSLAQLTTVAAPAVVMLSNLTQAFDGTAKSVSVTTGPTGLSTSVTYDGSITPPSGVGTFQVVATITAANYSGSVTDTLTIELDAPTVVVAGAISQTSLGVAWEAVSGVSNYWVDVATDSNFSNIVADSAGGTSLNATLTGLSANTEYYVRVWSNDGGANWNSDSAVAKTRTLASPIETNFVNAPYVNPAGPTGTYVYDGIPDEVVSANYPSFYYRVTDVDIQVYDPDPIDFNWYGYWDWIDYYDDNGYSISDHWPNRWPPAWYDRFSWWSASSYYLQVAGEATVDLPDDGYTYVIWGQHDGLWYRMSGELLSGLQTTGLTWMPPEYYEANWVSLVRYGKPIGGMQFNVGGVISSVLAGNPVTITLPTGGSISIKGLDILNNVLNRGAGPIWSVRGILGGLIPLPNSGVLRNIDIGINRRGQIQVGAQVGDGQTIFFPVRYGKPKLSILSPVNGEEMDDKKKSTVGEVIGVNADDDNNNGTADSADAQVDGENDLLQLKLHKLTGSTSGLSFKLSFGTNVKLWKNANKTDLIQSGSTTFDVGDDTIVYVEGVTASTTANGETITLQLFQGSNTVGVDSVKVHVARPIFALIGHPDGAFGPIQTHCLRNRVDDRENPYFLRGASGFWHSIFIWTDKPKAKLALSTQDAIVVYDGHASYGAGLTFAPNMERITDLMNVSEPLVHIDWRDMRSPAEGHPAFQIALSEYGDDTTTPDPYDPLRRVESVVGDSGQPNAAITTFRYYSSPISGGTRMNLKQPVVGDRTYDYHWRTVSRYLRLVVKAGDTDMPITKRWSKVLLNCCNSGAYYYRIFNHSTLFYTKDLCSDVKSSLGFIIAVMDGKTNAQIKEILDSYETVYEYKTF